MRIRQILAARGREVRTIRPEETVVAAVRKMVEHDIGSLVVAEASGFILAIVTERDCLREVARNPEFAERPVHEIATYEVGIAELDDDVKHVLDTMIAKRCRHVPVVQDGEMAGILSMRDVIGERLNESRTELKYLREYITGPHGSP